MYTCDTCVYAALSCMPPNSSTLYKGTLDPEGKGLILAGAMVHRRGLCVKRDCTTGPAALLCKCSLMMAREAWT